LSIRDDLVALGIPENCISNASSASEGRSRFIIHPYRADRGNASDTVFRVHVDGGWLGQGTQKVDYMFWCQSASGRRIVLLVELKGGDFGKALDQIQATLALLCRKSSDGTFHGGQMSPASKHDDVSAGGVMAYVVFSHGRRVPLYQKRQVELRQQYGVIVYHHERRVEINGVDRLPRLPR
jgi:hypothetical protein